jgi:hypothetical protein
MLWIAPFGDIKMLVELTRIISGEPARAPVRSGQPTVTFWLIGRLA